MRRIPAGRVATYGDIAAAAGRPLASRAVHTSNSVNGRSVVRIPRSAASSRIVSRVMPFRFVAVGASHLDGERGLLAMLQEDGFRVSCVW